MLVFLSDIHWTDGTSGETIHSGAFRGFVQDLARMVKDAKARDLEVVFLGDIFDLIRSEKWREAKVRPWDRKGPEQEKITKRILRGILNNPENRESLKYLRDLFAINVQGKRIPVRFTYLMGNHDWLINRYKSCCKLVQRALKLISNKPFPWEGYWKDYRVFARHGDLYDSLNYDGKTRDASSLGDAIVIELINRFPLEVEKRLGSSPQVKSLVSKLREVDNVRPYWEVPSWIMGVLQQTKQPELVRKVQECWNEMARDFLKLPFVKQRDRWRPDIIDAFQAILPIRGFEAIEKQARIVRKFLGFFIRDDYPKKAYEEPYMKDDRAQYVIYGHTHQHQIIPLDLAGPKRQQKIYFNTGTWRKVHVRTRFDPRQREFIGWHVLSFVCFYRSNENSNHVFEVWHGALGTQG